MYIVNMCMPSGKSNFHKEVRLLLSPWATPVSKLFCQALKASTFDACAKFTEHVKYVLPLFLSISVSIFGRAFSVV